MDQDLHTSCHQCHGAMPLDAISCPACGAFDPARVKVCPACDEPYPASFFCCPTDGVTLVAPLAATVGGARSQATGWSSATPGGFATAGGFDGFLAAAGAFWHRHMILNVLTIMALLGWALYYASFGEGFALLGSALSLPLMLSWPIALASSSKALGFVGWIDKWYFRLEDFFGNWDGKVGRWIMYPVVWAGGRWAMFASRRGDRFVAASLRMFGYSIALMLVAMIALITIYIIIGLVLLAVGLWVLGQILEEDTGRSRGFGRVPMVGRRGQKIYEGDGGWFSTDRQVGRVDRDGQIYEDDGGWFSTSKRVGKIDDDGRIYEGKGGWFDVDKQVGRVDPDGQIYEDDGGWFSVPKRVGRIDADGEVHEGDGGWFSDETRIGKTKRDP